MEQDDRIVFCPAPSPSLINEPHPVSINSSLHVYYESWPGRFFRLSNSQPLKDPYGDWSLRHPNEFVFGEMNFGLLEIDWSVRPLPLISLQSRRAYDGMVMFEGVHVFMFHIFILHTCFIFHYLYLTYAEVLSVSDLQPTPVTDRSHDPWISTNIHVCSVGVSRWRLLPGDQIIRVGVVAAGLWGSVLMAIGMQWTLTRLIKRFWWKKKSIYKIVGFKVK